MYFCWLVAALSAVTLLRTADCHLRTEFTGFVFAASTIYTFMRLSCPGTVFHIPSLRNRNSWQLQVLCDAYPPL